MIFKDKHNKIRVGFFVPHVGLYNQVMASTRIRVYDVIRFFAHDPDVRVGLYFPFRRYDIVVFQKVFDTRAYARAMSLKKRGIRIVLDINVNYYDAESEKILPAQRDAIMRFTRACDAVIASSDYIANVVNGLFPNIPVTVIEESIHEKYFSKRKDVSPTPKTFIWVGYYPKAKDLVQIRDVLTNLFEKYFFQVVIVSNKEHMLDLGHIPVLYVPYVERSVVSQILLGDIFIAPRNMQESYNQGHSFTKIGVAMALGLPVCASPVPSYLHSPAHVCRTLEEWGACLEHLMSDEHERMSCSQAGIAYCHNRYGVDVIMKLYKRFFQTCMQAQ